MSEELPSDNWVYNKTLRDCDLYLRKGGSKYTCFKVTTELDYPPPLIIQYCSEIEKRHKWDEDYDSLSFLRSYKMDTTILHVKIKAQWPTGPREALLLFQGYTVKRTGDVYLGSFSVEHPEAPIDETGKLTRITTLSGHYIFEALDNGKRTRLSHLTEFSFGGNIPKSLVQGAASDKFTSNMVKLKKLLAKEQANQQTKAS